MADTNTPMAQSTMVSGKMRNSTEEVVKHGQITQSTLETLSMAKSKGMGNSPGLMDPAIKANSKIITLKEVAITFGLINETMMELGKQIRCMATEYFHGMMVEYMRESMLMTRRLELDSLYGLEAKSTMDNGQMVNSMGLDSINHQRVR